MFHTFSRRAHTGIVGGNLSRRVGLLSISFLWSGHDLPLRAPAQTPRRASGRKSLLPNTLTANVAVALRGQQPAAGASRPRVRNAGFGAALGRRMESLRRSPALRK